jgi:uncharacterized membrane protein
MAETLPDDPRPVLLERMLFFSDAVFAIVLTLLALDLRFPTGLDDAHIFEGLGAVGAEMNALVMSFALVSVFWLAHLLATRALAQFDWIVAVANLVFLFTITLTPFVTDLAVRYGNQGVAWRLYCAVIVAISLAQIALIVASHRDELRIVRAEHHGRMWLRVFRASSPGVAFAIGLALSFAGLHLLSSLCWIVVPVLLLLLRWIVPERSAAPQPHAAPVEDAVDASAPAPR